MTTILHQLIECLPRERNLIMYSEENAMQKHHLSFPDPGSYHTLREHVTMTSHRGFFEEALTNITETQ